MNICGMEQLAARWAHNPKVTSSSLVPATTEAEVFPWLFCFCRWLTPTSTTLFMRAASYNLLTFQTLIFRPFLYDVTMYVLPDCSNGITAEYRPRPITFPEKSHAINDRSLASTTPADA